MSRVSFYLLGLGCGIAWGAGVTYYLCRSRLREYRNRWRHARTQATSYAKRLGFKETEVMGDE